MLCNWCTEKKSDFKDFSFFALYVRFISISNSKKSWIRKEIKQQLFLCEKKQWKECEYIQEINELTLTATEVILDPKGTERVSSSNKPGYNRTSPSAPAVNIDLNEKYDVTLLLFYLYL